MRIVILLLSFAAPAAMAATLPGYCMPIAQIMARAPFCEENREFVTAAQNCLKRIDQEILAYQKALSDGFVNRSARGREAQDSKFVNHDGNLGDTSASLAKIIKDAERAKSELMVYLEALRYPGDPMPNLLKRFKLAGYLSAFPCYHDRHAALASRIESLNKRIDDLRRTRSADLALLRRSGEDLKNLNTDPRKPAASAGHSLGAGAGKLQNNRPKNDSSSITGQIQNEKLP